MIVALALAFFAQTPEAAPRIEDAAERRTFDEAQRTLETDEALLSLHRGLWTYLSKDDGLRQAEEAYDALMELSSLRERVEDFEEVLMVDGDARADFERCMARLQRDSALRDAVEGLDAAEMEALPGTRGIQDSFAYLRAHPQPAVTFLMQRDAGGAVVETLRPLRDAMRRDTKLQSSLRAAWTTLDAQAGAREAVYLWWARVHGGGTAAARRYLALDAEFAPLPSQRRAWETREMAWAPRPDAVAWRDYVYARVRRDPALGPIYFRYLHMLRARPEVEKYAEDSFTSKHGAPPAWPLQGNPPQLPAWTRPELITKPGKPESPAAPTLGEPGVDLPGRPTVKRPSAPAKPVAPEPAQEPDARSAPLSHSKYRAGAASSDWRGAARHGSRGTPVPQAPG